jgi:hypothetical protein
MTMIRPKSGRATAPGSRNRAKASNLHDRLIRDMERPKHKEHLPERKEILFLIRQAKEAYRIHQNRAIELRIISLEKMFNYFYGEEHGEANRRLYSAQNDLSV